MDITNRRFKIIEHIGKRFVVCVELPRLKFKTFLGWQYGEGSYDESDLFWGLMGMDGRPLGKFDMAHGKPSAEFKSMSAARDFITDCKEQKRETIIE